MIERVASETTPPMIELSASGSRESGSASSARPRARAGTQARTASRKRIAIVGVALTDSSRQRRARSGSAAKNSSAARRAAITWWGQSGSAAAAAAISSREVVADGVEGGEEALLLGLEELVEVAGGDRGELDDLGDRGGAVAVGGDLVGDRGEQALALGVEDLLAGQAVVAAGQGAELSGLSPLPIAIALALHGRRLSGRRGQARAGWRALEPRPRAMRLASAGPR